MTQCLAECWLSIFQISGSSLLFITKELFAIESLIDEIEESKNKYRNHRYRNKYRNHTCHSCGKVGHIWEACKGKPQKVHQLEGSEPLKLVLPMIWLILFLSRCTIWAQASKVLRYPLNWTEPLLIELDTAVGVSVVSEETYKKHFIGTPLMPSNTRLRVYTRHPLKVHRQLILRPERRCPTSYCWRHRPIPPFSEETACLE